MDQPMFDIFKGTTTEGDATWLETVTSLANGRQRMEEIATESPGQYSVFSQATRSVVARTDTRKPLLPSEGQSETRLQIVSPRRRVQRS
jgi:hypothetical protein